MGNTKSLLHFNGANGGTTIVESTGLQAWLVNGTATISTDDKVLGQSSLKTTYPTAYIYTSSNANLLVGANDFTVDLRFKATTTNTGYLFTNAATYPSVYIQWLSSRKIEAAFYYTAINAITAGNNTALATGDWYHVALVRSGTTLKLYINGTAETTVGDCTGLTAIGSAGTARIGIQIDGYVDEFRFSSGVARWTANFTPPTSEYQLAIPTPFVFN